MSRSGDTALEIVRRYCNEIPVVILDECIPKIPGHELLREIHKLSPGTKTILTSGHYADEVPPPITNLDYAVFLHKPYSIQRLLQLVREYMSNVSH